MWRPPISPQSTRRRPPSWKTAASLRLPPPPQPQTAGVHRSFLTPAPTPKKVIPSDIDKVDENRPVSPAGPGRQKGQRMFGCVVNHPSQRRRSCLGLLDENVFTRWFKPSAPLPSFQLFNSCCSVAESSWRMRGPGSQHVLETLDGAYSGGQQPPLLLLLLEQAVCWGGGGGGGGELHHPMAQAVCSRLWKQVCFLFSSRPCRPFCPHTVLAWPCWNKGVLIWALFWVTYFW